MVDFVRPKTLRSALWRCPILTRAIRWLENVTKVANQKTVKIDIRHLRFLLSSSSSARLAPLREHCLARNTHEQPWNSPGRCLLNLVFSETTTHIWRVHEHDQLSAKCRTPSCDCAIRTWQITRLLGLQYWERILDSGVLWSTTRVCSCRITILQLAR